MFGDWGGCMTFTLMASIFGLYCTNVLGVDPVLMGTLTIIWTVWDAINGPMMGALMDKAFAKKHNKNGKFRPWLLRATPLLAGTVLGLKVLCVLVPAVFILGSWAAFKFVWNITPEVREKMAAHKAAQK